MSLARFCRKPMISLSPEDPVQRAADLMSTQHVGSVIAIDEGGRPVGVLTDRDVVCRVVAAKLDPARVPVKQVMSANPGVVREEQLIDEAVTRMRELGVRRLPVVDAGGKAIGMVSLDDLLVMLTAELGQTAAVIRSNRGP